MDWDLAVQHPIVQQAGTYAQQGSQIALTWLMSPAAWSQFATLVIAYLLAVLVARRVRKPLSGMLTPRGGASDPLSRARGFLLSGVPLLLPLLAYLLSGIGEQVIRSVFGSGDIIAFGKRLFLLPLIHAVVVVNFAIPPPVCRSKVIIQPEQLTVASVGWLRYVHRLTVEVGFIHQYSADIGSGKDLPLHSGYRIVVAGLIDDEVAGGLHIH